MRYLLILLYFFLAQANGHQFEKNNIIIKNPILKVNANSAKIGAGYFKIFNNSQKEVYLLKVVSKVSEKQEIHEVIEENNVFKMRPVTKGLLIKPGTEVVFKSQSYHIMFFKFSKMLEEGQMVIAELNFDNNLVIPIEFKVITKTNNHSHH